MSHDVADFATREVLRMERRFFVVRFLGALGAYTVVTIWLNAIRQTVSTGILWGLILLQSVLFISVFVVSFGRLRQCGRKHQWLLFIPLVLSRINDWEVVVLPVLALIMLFLSARNTTVAAEHRHMLPTAAETPSQG